MAEQVTPTMPMAAQVLAEITSAECTEQNRDVPVTSATVSLSSNIAGRPVDFAAAQRAAADFSGHAESVKSRTPPRHAQEKGV